MSKLYDFRFTVRKAEFGEHSVTIVYGLASKNTLHESCEQMSWADAKAHIEKLTAAQTRPCAGTLTMKYRDDRKPPGFDAFKTVYNKCEVTP